LSLWSDYVAAALVGTARAGLPALSSPTTPLEKLVAQLQGLPPERQLLAASATVALWQQAGVEPLVAGDGLPAEAEAEKESFCSSQATALLTRILQGELPALLPEWLRRLRESHGVLPLRVLPEMLDMAVQQAYLQDAIVPVLGSRGRWLAAHNVTWTELLLPETPEAQLEAWQTGSRGVRRALLRQARQADPQRAWTLLHASWSQEAAAERASFLELFKVGLNSADEPFLETTLDDRSKVVRGVAAELLSQLPGSGLMQRMKARLEPLIALGKGRRLMSAEKLKVTLPTECDAAMERDGIDPKPPSGIGEHTWLLLQIIAAVDPAYWCEHWEKTPDELIHLAKDSDEERALLEGWARAAIRCRREDWARALLFRWIEKPWTAVALRQAPYTFIEQEALIRLVPQADLEDRLIMLSGTAVGMKDEGRLLLTIFQGHKRPWGADLTTAFIHMMRSFLKKKVGGYWYWWNALAELALYADPQLVRESSQGWPENMSRQSSLDQWNSILEFRRTMNEAF